MTPTPDELRAAVDTQYIIQQLGFATAEQKERLAADLSDAFVAAQRAYTLRDVDTHKVLRVLSNGSAVTADTTGTTQDIGDKSLFRTLDFRGGTVAIDPTSHEIARITGGGGADCLFDFLVSTCFATLAGFAEGQSFTSLSGCTFKGFSTVNGAQAQATIDYPVSQTIIPVIAICGGTYSETNMTYAARQHWIGSGRKRTIIGSTAANITTNTINMTGSVSGGAVLYLTGLTIQAATGGGTSSAGGLKMNTATTVWAENCEFNGTGTTAARAGILSTGATIKFFATHCTFSGGFGASVSGNNCATYAENCEVTAATGFQVSEDSLIGNCIFTSSTTGVNVSAVIGRIKVHDCTFSGCATGIGGTGGTASNGLDFLDNTFDTCTLGIDLSALGTIASDNNEIAGNKFYGTGTPITWPSSANLPGFCHDNTTDTNAMFSGTRPFGMICWHNYGYGGVPQADNTKWDKGAISLVGQHATFSAQLDTPAFYFMNGTTRVSVAATNHTYAGAGTYYVSVNTSAVVSFEGGSFPVGELPLAVVTVVAGPRITTIDWYDVFLGLGVGGPGPVLDAAYVRRDGTTPLTGDWDAGSGRIIRIGKLRVGSLNADHAFLSGVTDQVAVDGNTAFVGIASSGGNGTETDFVSSRGTFASPTALSSGDAISDMLFDGYDGSNYQVGGEYKVSVDGAPSAGVMPVRHDFYVATDGLLAVTIRNDGSTEPGPISAPGTPASGVVKFYNETGTKKLKAKDDTAAVYNLMHLHVFAAVVDTSTASTTVPFALAGPFPHAGTFTDVRALPAENKTNGATSAIFDVHKILAANLDSDGQGTTIFTTQANRPTITNTHKLSSTTAPDVTTFAAGDYLAYYTDQVGTNLTFASISVTVRYT